MGSIKKQGKTHAQENKKQKPPQSIEAKARLFASQLVALRKSTTPDL